MAVVAAFIEIDVIQLCPMTLVTQMLSIQILQYINYLAQSLVESIKGFIAMSRIGAKKDKHHIENFTEWSIDATNRIVDTFKLADKTLGSLIFLEVWLSFIDE